VGNVNSEAVVQNKMAAPLRTRFLRFVPLDWNPSGWMGLRVEAYGCSYSESHRLSPTTTTTTTTRKRSTTSEDSCSLLMEERRERFNLHSL